MLRSAIIFMAAVLTAGNLCAEPPAAPPGFVPVDMLAAPSGTNGPPSRPTPFTAEMSAEFMRKVMETSAKIENIKQRQAERRAELFATHPGIKAHRARMVELQEQINAMIAADDEFSRLMMDRDILRTTMPTLPGAAMRPGGAPGFFPAMGR